VVFHCQPRQQPTTDRIEEILMGKLTAQQRAALLKLWTPIIVAILTLLGVLFTALSPYLFTPKTPTPAPAAQGSFDYQVRVQDKSTGIEIARAQVSVEVIGQATKFDVTDSHGTARLFIDAAKEGQPSRLKVEAPGYKSYDQQIDLLQNVLPAIIQLEPEQSVPQLTVPAALPATAAPGAATATAPPPAPSTARLTFPFDKTIESDIPGFTLTLSLVEFQEEGRMRWHVDFWNQTNQAYNLVIRRDLTYVVDENGQRYAVLADNTGEPVNSYHQEIVQSGVKVARWFEFDLPRNGAQTFTFAFAGQGHSDSPDFQPFQAKLTYAPENVPTATATRSASGAQILLSAKTVESDLPGFTLTITRVELQDNGRMRWYIDFWNQSTRYDALIFRLDQTYLVDENGQRYAVLAESTGTSIGYYRADIQAGVKLSRWFEFDAPRNNVKIFKLTFVGPNHSDTPDFQPFAVKLDY
jgi:hypothetical protein